MAKRRSADAQLIDNLQRKIRHLRIKEKQANQDGRVMDEAGFQRNQKNIQDMIDRIRSDKQRGKLTQEKIYEYAEKAKSNPNFSADKRKIRRVTEKLIGSEPEEIFDEMLEENDFAFLFARFSLISGKYVGASGDRGLREVAQNIVDSIPLLIEQYESDMDPEQISTLDRMAEQISSALQSRGPAGVVFPIN